MNKIIIFLLLLFAVNLNANIDIEAGGVTVLNNYGSTSGRLRFINTLGGTVTALSNSNLTRGTDPTVDLEINGNGVVSVTGIIKTGTGISRVSTSCTSPLTVNGGTHIIDNATGLGDGTVNNGGTLTYTVNTTGTRTVTVNAGGVINKGGFAHTGTTFVNNGGTINN